MLLPMEAHIEIVTGEPGLAQVRDLFREYSVSIGVDLSFQDFDRELQELPGPYAAPDGTLLLCTLDRLPAGCVAIRRWDSVSAELKRLFVRAGFRGAGCGSLLATRAIAAATEMGYSRILLDTLASMTEARRVYERLGFRETSPYRFNPLEGAVFMERILAGGPLQLDP